MAEFLKEKAKRYILANYGKCSIHEVAQKFNVSPVAVEDYIINELYAEEERKKREAMTAPRPNTALKWVNRTLIVLILVAIVLLVVSLTVSELSNNDLWQHLKNGQMVLETKRFQYADPYSCNAAGRPWINEAWFSGVIFYVIYTLIGVNGIIYLKTLVIMLMTALTLLNCHRLKTEFILFVPLTAFMIFNVGVRFLARTEMFSYVFIAAFLLILMQYKYRRVDRRILYLLPVLQVFWSNMHGSFIVGIIILGVFTACETARLLYNRYFVSFWQRDLLTWERLKPLFIISMVTFFACIINPYGFRLFMQPINVVIHQSDYIKTIYEWQSPFQSKTFYTSYAFRYYVVWMFLLAVSFIADVKRLDLTNLAISAFFFTMAAQMHRNITIFTIATCPILALNFQQAGEDYLHLKGPRSKQVIRIVGGIIILAILIPLIRISFKHGYIYRKHSSKPFGVGVAGNMPIEVTKYIQKNHIKGCCFNSYTYGTYLIFHCFPDVRVTMDSRAEHVYGEEFYHRHQTALYDVNAFRGILDEFDIEFILLKYQAGDLVKHCRYLRESGEWAMVYFDDSCFLYVRRLPEYADLIARDEYRHIHPLLTLLETRIPKEEIEGFIAESERNLAMNPSYYLPRLLLLNLYGAKGEWKTAVVHGEYLLRHRYKNLAAFLIMGLAYTRLEQFDKAREMYTTALALKPDSQEARTALQELESRR
ncbi:MAG: tetratricopeptide repeat protein [bacterium]